MSKTKSKYPLVEVEWDDHSNYAGWKDIDDVKDLPTPSVASVGYLIYEDKKRIILGASIYVNEELEDYQNCQTMIILKGTVTKRKILRKW